jgi:hypothetical protein
VIYNNLGKSFHEQNAKPNITTDKDWTMIKCEVFLGKNDFEANPVTFIFKMKLSINKQYSQQRIIINLCTEVFPDRLSKNIYSMMRVTDHYLSFKVLKRFFSPSI